MSRSYPINCTTNAQKPYRVAELALDRSDNPVELLWCKRCRAEHTCRAEQMLQTWREMMVGNEQALLAQMVRLKKALRDVEADLEDMRLARTSDV